MLARNCFLSGVPRISVLLSSTSVSWYIRQPHSQTSFSLTWFPDLILRCVWGKPCGTLQCISDIKGKVALSTTKENKGVCAAHMVNACCALDTSMVFMWKPLQYSTCLGLWTLYGQQCVHCDNGQSSSHWVEQMAIPDSISVVILILALTLVV